jgi:hypothetical protein
VPDDWRRAQKQRLVEVQKRLDELQARLPPQLPHDAERAPAAPLTVEPIRQRRFWIAVVLAVINASSLGKVAHDILSKPSAATLTLSQEQVEVVRDLQDGVRYYVKVPRAEFPLEWILSPREFLAAISLNLILLTAIFYSYWQQSRFAIAHYFRIPAGRRLTPLWPARDRL